MNEETMATYTPKKIRNTLFVVGITVAIILSIIACVCVFNRDMNFWSTYQGSGRSGNFGNVDDFSSAEDFAKNEAAVYPLIFLMFVGVGLLPGIVSAISHKVNPIKHTEYTHKKMSTSVLITIIFVVAALVFNPLFSLDLFFDDGLPDKASEEDVWYMAVGIVSDQLKAPSTAQFCRRHQGTITQDGDTWTIKGYVDAENSFGATLRNNFTVVITFTSETKYTIDECSITAR